MQMTAISRLSAMFAEQREGLQLGRTGESECADALKPIVGPFSPKAP